MKPTTAWSLQCEASPLTSKDTFFSKLTMAGIVGDIKPMVDDDEEEKDADDEEVMETVINNSDLH